MAKPIRIRGEGVAVNNSAVTTDGYIPLGR